MRKILLSVLVVGIIAVATFFVSNHLKNGDVANKTVEVTKKSNKQPKAKRIKEALEWRYEKLVNPEKGYFDPQDLYAAHRRADYLKNVHAKSGALNLQWNLIGPDNQGGRTRALMFDANVPNKLWAGSVGGGLFVSENGGNSWDRVVSYNGNFPIASIAQGSDGAIYVGTGEGLGNPLSGGNSSFNSQSPGNGIFKSSDGGATWQHLTATNDANDNQVISGGCTWCGVNAIAVSPINSQVVLAGSENGLHISSDGGATFTAASSPLSGGQIQAIQITSDGQIAFAVRNGALYRSVSVVDNFQSGWTIASGVGTGSRADVAIAPSNENYVYAVISKLYGNGHCMEGVYRSTDGGDNWTKIVQSGAPSYKSDPFNQPTEAYGTCSGQGWYDMTIAVNPADENKIYIGGITFYTWGEGIGFRRADKIDTEGGTPFDSDYIHADKHKIIFNPQDPTGNTMLVGSDGGVTLCNNALAGFPENLNFIQKNKGYATLQVYGMGAGAYGEVLSGNQDNGSQYIDGLGSSVQAASEISGGDGVYAEISNLIRTLCLVYIMVASIVQ
ncbi:MAG: sialidase family protein [Chitinophagales bacterium]